MFCNQCGSQVPDGKSFCPKCGAAQTAAQPPQNYGAPQGYPSQPPQNYGAPQGYPPPPPQNYGAPGGYGYVPRQPVDKKKMLLVGAVLLMVGFLIMGMFKTTMFRFEYEGRFDGEKKTYYGVCTMDNSYVADIKEDGFSDFSDYVDDGLTVTTTYITIILGALMTLSIIGGAAAAFIGRYDTAALIAAIASVCSAIPHIFFVILFIHLKSDEDDLSFAIEPVVMVLVSAAACLFALRAAKVLRYNGAPAAAAYGWR